MEHHPIEAAAIRRCHRQKSMLMALRRIDFDGQEGKCDNKAKNPPPGTRTNFLKALTNTERSSDDKLIQQRGRENYFLRPAPADHRLVSRKCPGKIAVLNDSLSSAPDCEANSK